MKPVLIQELMDDAFPDRSPRQFVGNQVVPMHVPANSEIGELIAQRYLLCLVDRPPTFGE